jgi:hypothetical protein
LQVPTPTKACKSYSAKPVHTLMHTLVNGHSQPMLCTPVTISAHHATNSHRYSGVSSVAKSVTSISGCTTACADRCQHRHKPIAAATLYQYTR